MAVNNPSVGIDINETGIIRKVSTVENIDFQTNGEYILYTVPVGYKFVAIGVVVRTIEAINVIGDGSFDVLGGSDDIGILNSPLSSNFNIINRYLFCGESNFSDNLPIIDGGDSVKFKVINPDSGTSLVVSVDLIGYLINS